MIAFTRGVPTPDMMPTDLLARSSAAAMREYGAAALAYGDAAGFPPLREWLAQQCDVPTQQLITGNGSINLLSEWIRFFLRPGDVVAIENPTYDRALTMLRQLGADIRPISLQADGPDVAQLTKLLRTERVRMLYTIADFHNPAGTSTSADKRRALAELAQQHDLLIVEDGAYHWLRYVGETVPQIRTFAPDHTLTTGSFSKLLAPGVRTGWAIIPERFVADFVENLRNAYIGPNYYAQATVTQAVQSEEYAQHIDRLHLIYRQRLEITQAVLTEYLSGTNARWVKPEGGFFFGIHLPPTAQPIWELAPSVELALVNGDDFFLDGQHHNFVRLPFCSLSDDEIQTGVRRLAALVERCLV